MPRGSGGGQNPAAALAPPSLLSIQAQGGCSLELSCGLLMGSTFLNTGSRSTCGVPWLSSLVAFSLSRPSAEEDHCLCLIPLYKSAVWLYRLGSSSTKNFAVIGRRQSTSAHCSLLTLPTSLLLPPPRPRNSSDLCFCESHHKFLGPNYFLDGLTLMLFILLLTKKNVLGIFWGEAFFCFLGG